MKVVQKLSKIVPKYSQVEYASIAKCRNTINTPTNKDLCLTMETRKSVKIQENSGFGVWGSLGAIFTIIVNKRMAQRLCSIILLHFGQVTSLIGLLIGRYHIAVLYWKVLYGLFCGSLWIVFGCPWNPRLSTDNPLGASGSVLGGAPAPPQTPHLLGGAQPPT